MRRWPYHSQFRRICEGKKLGISFKGLAQLCSHQFAGSQWDAKIGDRNLLSLKLLMPLAFYFFLANCTISDLPCRPDDPTCAPLSALLLVNSLPNGPTPLILYVSDLHTFNGAHISLLPGAPNGIVAADSECTNNAPPSIFGSSFKAMISDGANRIASINPNAGDGQVDWPLSPNTRYYRPDRITLIGQTDDKGLMQFPLQNPVGDTSMTYSTGLKVDWTTLATGHCTGWTTTTGNGNVGRGNQLDAGFVAVGAHSCGVTGSHRLLCVQQR